MFGSSNIVDLLTEYISYLKIVRETEVYHNAKRSQAKESIDIYGRLLGYMELHLRDTCGLE